ncbi:TMEM165/GDT1 family protein [Sphingomonas cavernae]|uniref:GDT1 family protein n=1 Tax=Sphingomonas cavernae TaxID=2320861 RepID=A0A418WS73_9SPHN|nr:TMEM165/GDT1 family protein [Sphingomonas cavernae]RJF94075.1 hypothetical protein D3876_07390 [Sphingomonas cavernae]
MDAFFPAFMAALLAEIGDKTQLLALALALHFRRIAPVLLGIALAALANSALAALAGVLLAPMLTHEAAVLMLALALFFAGGGAMIKQSSPEPVQTSRLGPVLVSFLAFFVLELGDKTQFLTFAIALRSGSFWLTMAGATAGVLLISAAVVITGRAWERLPVTSVRRAIGVLFALLGLWAAVLALRLI